MKTFAVSFIIFWIALVAFTSCVRADYNDVYSLYLERANYLHEVEMWTYVYNPELDKWYGIDIQNACDEVGRSDLKHCRYNTLWNIGQEFIPYKKQF